MRLLIFGAGGMLGHRLYHSARARLDAWGTVRDDPASYSGFGIFDTDHLVGGVRATEFDTVARVFAAVRPTVVVNCIGVVKQRNEAKDPLASLMVNSVFPHRLAALCEAAKARLIHLSTDCVFSGRTGGYREQDAADATDLYGQSKHLGEVTGPGQLTVRTSIVGRELTTTQGLVEWFLAQTGRVPGFRRAIFSGLTTHELSRVLLQVIESHPDLSGVYHVASAPIAKHDLLVLLNDALARGLAIDPDDSVQIDRSLDGSLFARATGYTAPTWREMVSELATDAASYDAWRRQSAG